MKLQTRPLITAGVAIIGTGLITAGTSAPTPPSIAEPAVQLAADSDFFTLWADVLDRAFTNVTALGTELVTPPVPVLQQVLVNQVGFLQDFLASPSDIWNIFGQMWDNLVAGVSAPFVPDTDLLSTGQSVLFNAISAILPTLLPDNPALAEWLLDSTATPFSGWLAGQLGVLLSPWLELWDSLSSMFGAIGANDWAGAWTDFINIPAHMTDGWLNGYGTLDLMGLLGSALPELPIGTIRDLNIELSGMLSGGGTLFGSVGADVCLTAPIVGCVSIIGFPMSGSESGPWGSLIEISHSIAQAVGWDGTGNPIDTLLDDPMVADLMTFLGL